MSRCPRKPPLRLSARPIGIHCTRTCAGAATTRSARATSHRAFSANCSPRIPSRGPTPNADDFALSCSRHSIISFTTSTGTPKRSNAAAAMSSFRGTPRTRNTVMLLSRWTSARPTASSTAAGRSRPSKKSVNQLRNEFSLAGKKELFDALRPHLSGELETLPYAQTATQLNMTVVAVKVTVHRLRQRYGELLRQEVAHTLVDPSNVEEEIRQLIVALSR